MDTHVRVLGILHIVFGLMGIVGLVVLLAVFGGAAGIVGASGAEGARTAVPILGVLGGVLSCLVLMVSIPGTIAGIGVLGFREWARILMLVVSVVDLLSVPLGTALGIYGLWTLLHRETIPLFRKAVPGAPA